MSQLDQLESLIHDSLTAAGFRPIEASHGGDLFGPSYEVRAKGTTVTVRASETTDPARVVADLARVLRRENGLANHRIEVRDGQVPIVVLHDN